MTFLEEPPQKRACGHVEGIEKRLVMWRRQLARNGSFPWVGTGICDDLVVAAKLLGADVSEFETPAPAAPAAPAKVEYDL